MMAERDLDALLRTLAVHRHPGLWAYGDGEGDDSAIFGFQEREGACHIAPAGATTPEDNSWVWLELTVYSDLHAVGFLAAVSTALAQAGVPCNAIAGRHHDHIFVPASLAETAIRALEALSRDACVGSSPL